MAKNQSIIDTQNLPEYRLLLRLSLPVILSLLFQGLYSLVDSIFLSALGEQVLSATSLAFVVQNLVAAFLSGISTGMNATISRALGAQAFGKARAAVFAGILVQGVVIAGFTAFGIWGVPAYFAGSTSDAGVIASGIAYLKPCMVFTIAAAAQITLERLLQSVGLTSFTLISQAAGTVVNIALDPILIFGWFGIPAMGIEGAAVATILGQVTAAAFALYFNLSKNRILFCGQSHWREGSKLFGEICRIGLPSAAMGVAASAGNYCINWLLISFSPTSNAAFGVYTKLQSIALMPTQGFFTGLVTMIAFFYGQRNLKRIHSTLLWGVRMIGGWSVFCACVFFFLPEVMLSIFHPTEQMLQVGVPAFRIIGSTFLLSGFMMVLNAFFQAVGRSMFSLVTSLSRQIFVRIPAALLLARLGEINLLWLCWPISEVVSDIVCVAAFVYLLRKIQTQLRLPDSESGSIRMV